MFTSKTKVSKNPEKLSYQNIKKGLLTNNWGHNLVCFNELTSTNDWAAQLADKGKPSGTLVITEYQTHGRGRRYRTWHSNPGDNLLFSLLLRPPWLAEHASLITLLMAVGITNSIRELTGLLAQIKWPNDILINQHKVSGILTEVALRKKNIKHLICGVGININSASKNSAGKPAVFLNELLNYKLDRITLLQKILFQTEKIYEDLLTSGSKHLLKMWMELSCMLNKQVAIKKSTGEILIGESLGINDKGALRLRLENGIIKNISDGQLTFL